MTHLGPLSNVFCFVVVVVALLQYTKQTIVMVHETPELYKSVDEPYIAGFPAKRTQW
jgi:hypothetical protein